jgi:hypothetical protein
MQTANETDQNAVMDSKAGREAGVDPRVDEIIEKYFQALLDQTEVPEDLLEKVAGRKS